ncbi:MAG TPA: helix-turn-helix domain-containing protein, partial [Miltoncostaeaceae bacterium]|nr:helix-turn-helix domain-containing protein [Miltoncostaeaceae bacterium]
MSAPITASQIARLAGVSRSAVSNWRRRHADFPAPLGEGAGASPLFDRAAVERWLHERGLSTAPADTVDALRLAVSAGARRLPEDAALAVAICALAGERPDGPKEAERAIVAA